MATVLDLPTLESLRSEQRDLRDRLARLRGRLKLQLTLEFLVDGVIGLVAMAAVLVFLDWWFRLSPSVRFILLISSVTGLLLMLGARAARRWDSSRLDELSLAMTLDRYRPGTGQQIVDVLQLPELLSLSVTSTSPAMVRLAVRQACAALAASDWHLLWNRKRTAIHVAILLAGLMVPVMFALLAPQAARLSLSRWLLVTSERWPQRTYLTVMGLGADGRLLAPRDERFLMEVRSDLPLLESSGKKWIVQGRGQPLALKWKPESPAMPKAVAVRERTAEGKPRNGVMAEAEPAHFRYEFPPTSKSSTFELTGGDDWLGPIILERVDRPALAETKVRVREPGATYDGFRNVEDAQQHLVFLPDTIVELTLIGSEPIADVRFRIQSGNPPELKRSDERTFSTQWTLREATTLEFLLKSARTGLESRPTFLSIGLLKDREPRVTLRAVGVSSHVTAVATIPLTVGATDDFGLAALRLQIERTLLSDDSEKENDKEKEKTKGQMQTKRESVRLPLVEDKDHPVLDHQARHDLFLQTDPPKVGTVIRIVAEADDRCARGVQVGRSTALLFQVVAPEEMFYEILLRQRAERAKFIGVLDIMEKQTPVLAGKPKAEDLVQVMRIQHSAARQLEQIGNRVADTLQEMKLNQVGSPKSQRLLQDGVIEPMRALTAGPMNELRTVLQALTGTGSSPVANLESARRLHGQVVAKMKGILDQMSQWESFVDVVNQVAEVIRMQHEILQATEKARETRTKEIFDDKP
ncbi:MAG: hypothetical protein ACLQGP_13455 [Isosphaeraceae bacterium]